MEVSCEQKFKEQDTSDPYVQEMLGNLRKARLVVADIVAHIITCYNDADLMRVVGKGADYDFIWSNVRTKKQNIKKTMKKGYKQLFIQSPKCTRRITQILLGYLLRESWIGKNSLLTEELTKKISFNVFPYFFSKKDAFSKCMDFLSPVYMSYYFSEMTFKQKLRDEARAIRKSFKAQIKGFIFDSSMSDPEVLRETSLDLHAKITEFMNKFSGEKELFVKIVLTELNYCDLILAYLRYTIETLPIDIQDKYIALLTRICKNNFIAQAKLFDKVTLNHVENIHMIFPMKLAQLFYSIFKANAFLLHNHAPSWEKMFKIYLNVIEQLSASLKSDRILLAMFYYNKLIQDTLLQWEEEHELQRGVLLLQNRVAVATYKLLSETVIPFLTSEKTYYNGEVFRYDPIIVQGMKREDYNPFEEVTDEDMNNKNKHSLRIDVYLSILRAFNKATRNVYRKVFIYLDLTFSLFCDQEIHEQVVKSLPKHSEYAFLLKNRLTYFVYLEITKLTLNFTFFPQNHIVDKRLEWNRNESRKEWEMVEKYMNEEEVIRNIEFLKEVYQSTETVAQLIDEMLPYNKLLAKRESIRTHVLSLAKLLKGISVSYELVNQGRAQRLSKKIKELIATVKENFKFVYSITRLKPGMFPDVFTLEGSGEWENRKAPPNQRKDSSLIATIPSRFRERKEVGNPWLLEIRTICFQIVDFLYDSFLPEDRYLLALIHRKGPVDERHRQHLITAHKIFSTEEDSSHDYSVIFENVNAEMQKKLDLKENIYTDEVGESTHLVLIRQKLIAKYEEIKAYRLEHLNETKFFKIISFSVESQATLLLKA